MKKKKETRPVGATLLSVALGWLGVAGFLNGVVWPLAIQSDLMRSAPPELVAQFPPAIGSIWFAILAVAYGATALFAAICLWKQSPLAPSAFLAWAGTVVGVAVGFSVESASVSYSAMVLFMVPVLLLLAAGWLYTRRLVSRVTQNAF